MCCQKTSGASFQATGKRVFDALCGCVATLRTWGIRHRHPRHLLHRGRPVRLLQAAACDPEAGAADADRHHARPLGVRHAVPGDILGWHHRTQLDPARGLHPWQAWDNAVAAGASGGGCDPVQAGILSSSPLAPRENLSSLFALFTVRRSFEAWLCRRKSGWGCVRGSSLGVSVRPSPGSRFPL